MNLSLKGNKFFILSNKRKMFSLSLKNFIGWIKLKPYTNGGDRIYFLFSLYSSKSQHMYLTSTAFHHVLGHSGEEKYPFNMKVPHFTLSGQKPSLQIHKVQKTVQ